MTVPSIALSKRPATVTKLNPRVEWHGEDSVPACDISLSGIALTSEGEINSLLGGSYAFRSLFTNNKGAWEPALPMFSEFALESTFDEATVLLTLDAFGQGYELAIAKAKVARIHLALAHGGVAAVSLQVKASGIEPADFGRLVARLEGGVHVEIREGKVAVKSDRQIDLPLNSAGADEPQAA